MVHNVTLLQYTHTQTHTCHRTMEVSVTTRFPAASQNAALTVSLSSSKRERERGKSGVDIKRKAERQTHTHITIHTLLHHSDFTLRCTVILCIYPGVTLSRTHICTCVTYKNE